MTHPFRNPSRRHWLALGTLGALAAACSRHEPPAPEAPRPVRSQVARASGGAVGAVYAGSVVPRYESRLGFQTSGKVVARLVEVGQRVKRGQPLMRLDPAQENLHLAAALAQVDGAQSRVNELKTELARTEQLLARQFASQAELDKQRTALAEAESQLKSAQAQQQLKANQRGYTELLADRDGVVTALRAEAGHVVSPGQVVVELAGEGEREIAVSVPESRVAELRQARTLQVSVWAEPTRRWAGTLRELAPDADSVTRTYAARIAVQGDAAALMLGMTATVHLPEAGSSAGAIRLPLTAVLDRGGSPQVWVLDRSNATVKPRPVTLGEARQDSVAITAGLAEGETVVTAGVHLLVDGQKVLAVADTVATNPVAGAAR